MKIEDIQEQIINEFSYFEDWMDRYNHLIDMGKNCPIIDPKYKTKNYLISGCQSRVWLHARQNEGRIIFTADSDAVITKGIVNLLIRVFSNQPIEAIIDADISFIDKIGLKEHLSPTRANGLVSMIKQLKMYALAYETQMES